jgi:hypothetical protein
MKTFIVIAVCLATNLLALGDVPPDQGGPGTIDPATIKVNQVVRFSLVDGQSHAIRALGTDSAGNHIVGSVLTAADPRTTTTIRSVITKVDRTNKIVWARERTVTSDSNGYYEQWGDGKAPMASLGFSGICSLEVGAIAVDAQDNVFVAFNLLQPDPNNAGHGLARFWETLVVKFDAAGNLLWRQEMQMMSNGQYPYDPASIVRSFAISVNGSVLAMVDNYENCCQNAHQTVVFRLAADGTRLVTVHYGLSDSGDPQFSSVPNAITEDSAGNVFVVSTESPYNFQLATPDKAFNVIRKLDSAGNVRARHDLPVYPGYTAGSTNYPLEGFVAARADANGNLYLAGTHYRQRPGNSTGADQGESNQLALKLKSDLTQVWRTLGPQATGIYVDQPLTFVSDMGLSANGVTVAGYTHNSGTGAGQNDDYWEFGRYDLDDGHLVWHRRYRASIDGTNQGGTLAAAKIDAAGNVYGTGLLTLSNGSNGLALIKYSDGGVLQFVKVLPDAFAGVQPSPLWLPSATNRPTLAGIVASGNNEVQVVEFDNPAVVGAPDVFGNISTRVRVGGGDNVLIGGFIVTGSQGATKKVLVRAIGPSLNNFGLAGLPDPVLELHDSAGNVMINDNWQEGGTLNQQPYASQTDAIQAVGLAPTNLKEAAMIVTVPAGNTTAIIRSKTDSASGTAVIEVYDLEANTQVQLANISTRGKVELGNDPMIAGIIVLGQDPQQILVRALGPSLANFGVANTLSDPSLALYNANGALIATNDDWKDQSGNPQGRDIPLLQPGDDREAAVRVVLTPAPYTAIVRAADKAPDSKKTGVTLVEAYHLQ